MMVDVVTLWDRELELLNQNTVEFMIYEYNILYFYR